MGTTWIIHKSYTAIIWVVKDQPLNVLETKAFKLQLQKSLNIAYKNFEWVLASLGIFHGFNAIFLPLNLHDGLLHGLYLIFPLLHFNIKSETFTLVNIL